MQARGLLEVNQLEPERRVGLEGKITIYSIQGYYEPMPLQGQVPIAVLQDFLKSHEKVEYYNEGRFSIVRRRDTWHEWDERTRGNPDFVNSASYDINGENGDHILRVITKRPLKVYPAGYMHEQLLFMDIDPDEDMEIYTRILDAKEQKFIKIGPIADPK